MDDIDIYMQNQSELIMSRRHFQVFMDGKPLSITPYGNTMGIAALPAAGAFSSGWNLVGISGTEYTLVYQYETVLRAGDVEEIWHRRVIDYSVSMTFGEIDGMWRNKNNRLRLYCRFISQTQEGFNDALIMSFDILSKSVLSIWENYVNRTNCERMPSQDRYSEEKRIKFMEMVKGPDTSEDLPFFAEEGESQDLPFFQPIAKVKGGFADVAGFDELKHRLSDEVIWPLKNKAKAAKYRITPPSGMLLYGPAGCGKTFFAQKFAEETGFSFKLIVPSNIGGMIIHETQIKVAELFAEAQREAPCIICFDEIDAIVPRRTSTPGLEYQNTEVNEFLAQMNNCGEKGIFIIGTTNNKDLIDPAALRTGRLDYHVEIPKPDRIQRVELFRVCLQNRPMESYIDFESLAMSTDGFTASDIAFVVNKAALAAAKADLLISTDIVSRCISEVQTGRMNNADESDKEEKAEYVDCQFPIAKKEIVS